MSTVHIHGGREGGPGPASTVFMIRHIETVVVRDEGGCGMAGLWDEGREALWWPRPCKLGGGICICEECDLTILYGRKGGQLAAL